MIEYEDKERFLRGLEVGKVEKMCDSSNLVNGKFEGLFIGQERGRFIFLSRRRGCVIEEKSTNIHRTVIKWNISGEGVLYKGYFLFDGYQEREKEEDEEYITVVEESDPKHKEYEQQLTAAGL